MSAVSHLRLNIRPFRLATVAVLFALAATSCGAIDSISGDSSSSSGEFVVQAYVEDEGVESELDLGLGDSSRGMRVLATDETAIEPTNVKPSASAAEPSDSQTGAEPEIVVDAATPTTSTLVEAAQKSRTSNTRQFEIFMVIDYGSEAIGTAASPFVVGAAAGDWTSLKVDMSRSFEDVGGADPETTKLNYIFDSSTLYLNAPLFASFESATPGFLDLISYARTVAAGWGRVDLAMLGGAAMDTDTNPVVPQTPIVAELLSVLDSTTNVRDGGTSSVRGVDTTVLLADISFDAIAVAMDNQSGAGLFEEQLRNVASTTAQVHIDADGYVRRVEWNYNLKDALSGSPQSATAPQSFWLQLDLFDFDDSFTISPPQNSTDITADVLRIVEANKQRNGG